MTRILRLRPAFAPLIATALLAFGVQALPARAGDVVLFFGTNDFEQSPSSDRTTFGIEYHTAPFHRIGRVDLSFAAGAVGHANGDYWVGGGLSLIAPVRERWFVEASFMPGFYNAAELSTDIGSALEFRSLLGAGRWLTDSTALSVGITHKSNAGTANFNPGVNALALRLRHRF